MTACTAPIRVAVIGGGPSAMFFCHSLETKTREARQQEDTGERTMDNNESRMNQLLRVTCFEMAPTPGGVWKAMSVASPSSSSAHRDHSSSRPTSTTTNKPVYEELWTNGSSQCMEFYDYTLDEHFNGEPVPVYLPRQDVNEYLINRVTKNCPTFFEDYFEFCTEVVRVRWMEDAALFELTVRNTQTEVFSVRNFDKCIWAAGLNSQCSIPLSLQEKFENATGTQNDDHPMTLLHSGETDRIRSAVPEKQVLLIGGGLSAEDLALQCLKWGAAHVHVVARSDDPEVSWVTRWPWNRVTVHLERGIKSVHRDGTIELEKMRFEWPWCYKSGSDSDEDSDDDDEDDEDEEEGNSLPQVLTGIDTVIFCTGYQPNLKMLDKSLKPESETLPCINMGQHPTMFIHSAENFEWSSWKMKSDHDLYSITGDVPAAQGRMIRLFFNHPDIFRGVFLQNPSMMYMSEDSSDTPLLALDVKAWLLCSYLTGSIPMPSVEQLRQASREQIMEQFHIPAMRCCMDEEYFRVLVRNTDSQFWKHKWVEEEKMIEKYALCLLARIMEEGQYPGLSLGTNMKLNNFGEDFYSFSVHDTNARTNLQQVMEQSGDLSRTFRDDTEAAENTFSLYSGKKSRPLKKRWMDIIGPCSIKNGDI